MLLHKIFLSLVGLVVLVALGSTIARAAEQKWVLEELLNRKWGRELLSYHFEAGNGLCVPESVTLTGPKGVQPVQLTDVKFWPDSQYVKSANVVFVAEALEPRTTGVYILNYGAKAVPKSSTSDLKVRSGDGVVEIQTGRCDVRLLVGNKTYATPIPAKDVPGPLQAIKMADGSWQGGSHLYGEAQAKEWSARLVDSGPVVAQVEYRCVLTDETIVLVRAQVVEGDNAVRWEMEMNRSHAGGMEFLLGKYPGVKEAILPKGWGQWARDREVPIAAGNEPFCQLSPRTSIAGIFPDSPSKACLTDANGAELHLQSHRAGAWADPVRPLTYAGYETWNIDMIPKIWENWKTKRLPVSYAPDGMVSMKVTFAQGRRFWSVSAGTLLVGTELDVAKDYVLKWPDDSGKHPRLFLSKEEVEDAWRQASPDAARVRQYSSAGGVPAATEGYLYSAGNQTFGKKAAGLLRDNLALLGDYDTMRHAIPLAAMYDALIDTEFVSSEEKDLYRAQLAYLGYRMADPEMWSMERGYISGNPNMSVAYTLTLGVIACLIPEHPMAKTWAEYATSWMDKWLTDDVGENGEWLPEGGHYGQVSIVSMLAYAVAAKRAGYHDFLSDSRFKKLMLYVAKQSTPPDPRRENYRVSPSVGRGTSGDTNAMFGVLARATAESDPDFSQTMQWMWNVSGRPMNFSNWDWRLGGFGPLFINPDLPSQKPEWESELFPGLGVVLRSGLGDALENYLNILSNTDSHRNLDIWAPGVGSIAEWYAYGKPVSKAFSFGTGYAERHELLRDGVLLGRNSDGSNETKEPFGYYTKTDFRRFSTLPGMDYVCATYRITHPDDRGWFLKDLPAWPKVKQAGSPALQWTRQVLFMKDDEPEGPHYLVLRDSTTGGQPTAWQFWSLSEKIGTSDETANLKTFLAETPGTEISPARELPAGDRYTAIGQFDVDLEYFIASPLDTPRSTLRYGGERLGVAEFQDLLHLQASGDGSYYVAIYPRKKGAPAPNFSTLDEGKIIKITGEFGSDYCFLTEETAEAKSEDVSFQGTAGTIQRRTNATVLGLPAPGEVICREFGVSASIPVELRISAQLLVLTLSEPLAGGEVTVIAPDGWSLMKEDEGDVALSRKPGSYTLAIGPGRRLVRLMK